MSKAIEIATRLRKATRDSKLRSVSPAARLMHLAGIVYCVEMRTDGLIPHAFLRWFDEEFVSAQEDPRKLAARIIEKARAEAERHKQATTREQVN